MQSPRYVRARRFALLRGNRLLPSGPTGSGTSRWPFRKIALVLSVTSFGAGLPTPLYSIYEQHFGFGSGELGLVFAAYTAGVVGTLFFVAPLADTFGRKRLLYAGMALTALSAVAFFFANGAAALALARILSGLAVGATTGTATAAMSDLEPNRDQHHVARVSVAANFGGVATGILLSGLLVQYAPYSTELPFVVLFVASLAGWALTASTVETSPSLGQRAAARIQRIRVPSDIRGPFWVSAGALASCYSIYGLFAALAPSLLRTHIGIQNSAEVAAIGGLMFVMAAAIQVALAQVRDRRALLLGLPILVVGLGIFAAADLTSSAAGVIAGAGVIGSGVGLAFMGSVTLIDRVSPERLRTEILSGFYLTGYLALAVPTIGVAEGAEWVGLDQAGLAFAVTLAVIATALFLVLRHTPTPAGGEGRSRARS